MQLGHETETLDFSPTRLRPYINFPKTETLYENRSRDRLEVETESTSLYLEHLIKFGAKITYHFPGGCFDILTS